MYEPELEMLFNKVIKAILPESFGILWQEIKDIFDGPLQEVSFTISNNNEKL